MSHMTRKLFPIFLLLALIMTGCAAPAVPTDDSDLTAAEARIAELEAELATSSDEDEEVINIRYLVPQWASSTDRRAERQIAFQSVLDSFHLRYPNIQVEEVVYDGSQVTASQELASGNVDAIWINNFWYPEWKAAGLFADLTPFMDAETEAAYFDWTIDALRSVDGELGGLWHNTDTPIYFYRSDLVSAPPQTWNDVVEAAQTFRAENPDQFFITYPLVNWFQTNAGLYTELGGELVDENGAPILFSPENRAIWEEMFTYYVDMVANDLMPAQAAVNNHNDQMPLVYAGDVVSFVGNNNMHIRGLQPNLPPEEYELWSSAPLPYPGGADEGAYVAGGWVIALAAQEDPARQEAAALWVQHATSFSALRDTNKAGGWVPTRPDVITEDPFYANDPFMLTTLEALEDGYVRPFFPIIGVINEAMSAAASSAVSGESTIDEALSAAEATIMSEYEALTGE